MRVALFIPCFIDQFYPEVGKAMVAVLRRVGVDPVFPAEQTCCGQPAFNTGYWNEARRLAERYCEIFADAEAIVSPSGSCTAMVRNFYPELLGRTPHAAANTFEFAEFLVKKLGVTDVGARFPASVTYHDACHSRRELGLKEGDMVVLENDPQYMKDLPRPVTAKVHLTKRVTRKDCVLTFHTSGHRAKNLKVASRVGYRDGDLIPQKDPNMSKKLDPLGMGWVEDVYVRIRKA